MEAELIMVLFSPLVAVVLVYFIIRAFILLFVYLIYSLVFR